MSGNGWRSVSAESPCYVCGKPDWCSVSSDGEKAICRREGSGASEHKVDTSGVDYWLHRLKDQPVESAATDDGPEVCSQVPGLYKKGGESARWSVAGAAGMLVPARDADGRVVALKVRADDPGNGSKYSYMSSSNYGGPGPGSPLHVPLLEEAVPGTAARLTEGELQADVATALSGMLSVSVPGVSSWRNALPVLKALGFGKVHLAFDAD